MQVCQTGAVFVPSDLPGQGSVMPLVRFWVALVINLPILAFGQASWTQSLDFGSWTRALARGAQIGILDSGSELDFDLTRSRLRLGRFWEII